MGFSSQNSEGSPLSEINITPLVDVMLVLMIIFMVTAPMMENGIPITLPKTVAKSLPKESEMPIILVVSKEGRLFLGKTEISFKNLQGDLKGYFKNRAKELLLKADGDLPYRQVAEVMAIVKASGIQKMGLVTEPLEKEGK